MRPISHSTLLSSLPNKNAASWQKKLLTHRFGYRRCYYQALHGAFVTGMIGLVFGLIYLWIGKRNLLPLVLVHGLGSGIAQTSRFLG